MAKIQRQPMVIFRAGRQAWLTMPHTVTAAPMYPILPVQLATFTFTGTGVDIYSRTDMTTGTVLATLSGKDDAGTSVSKALIVDNYAQSYDDDSSGDADGYYQIPTLSFDGLAHGTYTVTIRVTTAAGSRSTYYLDGIRVIIRSKTWKAMKTVQDAYTARMN